MNVWEECEYLIVEKDGEQKIYHKVDVKEDAIIRTFWITPTDEWMKLFTPELYEDKTKEEV